MRSLMSIGYKVAFFLLLMDVVTVIYFKVYLGDKLDRSVQVIIRILVVGYREICSYDRNKSSYC